MKFIKTYPNPLAFLSASISIFLLFCTQVRSQQSQPNCNNPRYTVEYNYCAGLEYKAVDQKLNQVYQQLISTVSGEEREKLVDAQVTWIEFRDKNCDFTVYRSRTGTGYPSYRAKCLERVTQQRIEELQDSIQQRSN